MQIDHRKKNPLENLQAWLQTQPGRLLICAESTGRREVLSDLFKRHQLNFQSISGKNPHNSLESI